MSRRQGNGGAEVSLRDRLGRESDRMVKGTMPKSERSRAADAGGYVGNGSKGNSFKGNTVLVEDITWWDVLTIDEQRIDGLCDELRQKAQSKLDHDYDMHIRTALDQDSYLWRQRAERHAKHRYEYDCELLREQTQLRRELLASRVKEFGDKRSKLHALFESVGQMMRDAEPVRVGIGTGGSDASQGDTQSDMNRAVVQYAEDVVSRYLQRCAFGMDADVPLTLAERSRHWSRR